MTQRFQPAFRLTTGLALLILLLSGCESGDAPAPGAEQQTARDNVEAMAREHADDTIEASDGAQIAPQRAVVSERLAYAELDEGLVYGHFVFPSDMIDPLPAVIMIHEWWGLNDNVRAMADRLAAEGYIVFAVDLFEGEVAESPREARALMTRVVENPEAANENIRSAYNFVTRIAGAPKIAALGWCFGGGWSLNTAMLFPDELDAAVIYYGQVSDDEELLRPIRAPILGFFGGKDKGIPVESVRAFETALQRLRKTHEIHIYPEANHAFANPTGRAYDAEAAEDAWQKTLDFLAQNLAADDSDG